MIAQLKAENFELKQKEREYNVLNSQLLDLEHRFRLLQEEKIRMDSDAKDREEMLFKKNYGLQEDLHKTNEGIVDVERQIRDVSSRLSAHKSIVDDRNAELARLKKNLADLTDESLRLQRARRATELDLQVAHDGHKAAESEVTGLLVESDRLKKSKILGEDRLHNAESEVEKLKRRLAEVQTETNIVDGQRIQKEKDIDAARQSRKYTQGEVEALSIKNNRLLDEKDMLAKKLNDLDVQARLTSRKYDDISVLLDAKEKEYKSIRSASGYAESKEYSTREDLRKIKTENETFQILLDKYRGDVEFQKRLRDDEAMKKYHLEDEKKRLSREAMLKDIEARTAKKELEKYQGSHERLLEENEMVEKELEAVKEHTGLLESQNENLHKELDTFVDTNEKVRKDLDRKDIVDYIKNRNQGELEKSIEKVRTSLSPKRSPYKSPAKSPSTTH